MKLHHLKFRIETRTYFTYRLIQITLPSKRSTYQRIYTTNIRRKIRTKLKIRKGQRENKIQKSEKDKPSERKRGGGNSVYEGRERKGGTQTRVVENLAFYTSHQ